MQIKFILIEYKLTVKPRMLDPGPTRFLTNLIFVFSDLNIFKTTYYNRRDSKSPISSVKMLGQFTFNWLKRHQTSFTIELDPGPAYEVLLYGKSLNLKKIKKKKTFHHRLRRVPKARKTYLIFGRKKFFCWIFCFLVKVRKTIFYFFWARYVQIWQSRYISNQLDEFYR